MIKIKKIAIILGIASILVIIHEGAHLLTALYFEHKVQSISIGFGMSLYNFTINDIVYHIRLIPLGGYIEIPEIASFPFKEKLLILISGVSANFIIASLIAISIGKFNEVVMKPFTLEKGSKGMYLFSKISMNLAAFNIIPIIFFDGGKILVAILENIVSKDDALLYTVMIGSIIMTICLVPKKK